MRLAVSEGGPRSGRARARRRRSPRPRASPLAVVGLFLVTLEGLHEVGDRAGPEQPGDQHDEPDPRPRAVGRRDGRPELGQLARPDVGVPPLVRRDPAEGFRPGRVLLDLGERVVEDDRVAFELQILEAGREVDGRHAAHRTRVRVLAAYVAPRLRTTPVRHLDSRSHEARRHPVSLGGRRDRGDAPGRGAPGPRRADDDRARRGRGAAAQDRRPSAPGRLVRPCDAGGPARPATRRRPARDQVGRRLPGEPGERPARDPRGRDPQRSGDRACRGPSSTAARSPRSGRRRSRAWRWRGSARGQLGRAPPRAAIIGAGVQGHSHLEVLGHVLPGVELAIHDRHPDRAEALAEAARATPGIAGRGHGRRRRATRSPTPTSSSPRRRSRTRRIARR